MDNKSTTKRMIGAVVLVLIAALLLAWLLKGKNKSVQEQQELIADQTQEASPILGFPGVNDDEKNADGTVAQNAGDGSATEDGSYVIGAADQATDNAQQQAQNALAAGGDAASSAAQGAADGAGQVAAVAAGAAAGAATAASQAGQQVADNATGFQVRDPQNQDGGDGGAEQRPIVENGEVKTGTGSMGGTEVAAGTQDQQSGGGDATQAAAATGGAAATQSSGSGDSSGSGSGSAAQQTASAGSSSGNGNSGGSSAAKPAKKAANPKLVNEKPVPSPRTQSASAGNRSSGSSASRSGSSSSASSRASGSAAAAGGNGYAIQVLAASSRSKAEAVRKDIARDGYPAFVVRAKVNGKTVYRVRVGTYPGKGAARTVQGKMKARYTKNQYVQNSFVTRN